MSSHVLQAQPKPENPSLPGGLSFALPDCERLRIRLRFTREVRFPFRHEGVFHGLLCSAISGQLPAGFIPFLPESGRVHYAAGDVYTFGLTVLGATIPASFFDRLAQIGQERPGPGPRATLQGNFSLESIDVLGAPSIIDEATDLAARSELSLQFLSPLRLIRPEEHRSRGHGFFGSEYFPATIFLRRLWHRFVMLTQGAYLKAENLPEVPSSTECDPSALMWIDIPMKGAPGKPGRPNGMSYGGVMGTVRLRGLTPEWSAFLALAQHIHAGKSTRYGFGKFRVLELGAAEESYRATTTYLDRVAHRLDLENTLSGVRGSKAEGIDSLAQELREGTYRPAPLSITEPAKNGLPLMQPSDRDARVQQWAAEELTPAIETFIAETYPSHRRGFSRSGSMRGLERAWKKGFRILVDIDLEYFCAAVSWEELAIKVRALLPLEPLVETIEQWVHAPAEAEGKTIRRTCGLPRGGPISALLVRLFLGYLDDALHAQGLRLAWISGEFVILARKPEDVEGIPYRGLRRVVRSFSVVGLKTHESAGVTKPFPDTVRGNRPNRCFSET